MAAQEYQFARGKRYQGAGLRGWRSGSRQLYGSFDSRGKVRNRSGQPFFQSDGRLPAEKFVGARDVWLALSRIVCGQRLVLHSD